MTSSTCSNRDFLIQFLNERLTAEEESRFTDHLSNCPNCQKLLEGIAVKDEAWHFLKEGLHELSSHQSIQRLPEEPEDTQLKQFQTLLAPSDLAKSLGRLGRYEIVGVVGQGSSGVVFKAHDTALHRFVAIKMLLPGFARIGTSRKRFERESQAIASVRDPHVIEVHGVDEFQGNPYIVMQYIPDGSLQSRLNLTGELTTKEVCQLGIQIANGLSAAHRQGIIHRDIKPANILLEDGLSRAVVTDFGLAWLEEGTNFTMSGMIAGTPQFMSPEQASGESLDHRSDLFSLGSVLYNACTGRLPFNDNTLMGVVGQVCHQVPKPIRECNPEIDEWLACFIHRLLEKERDQRFQSAAEVASILSDELTFMRRPTTTPMPDRSGWLVQTSNLNRTRRTRRSFLLASGIAAATTITAPAVWLTWGRKTENQRYGIQLTLAEQTQTQAKAAYDLAYETHVDELSLRGDMSQSIRNHQRAFHLGYRPAQSAFNLTRAFAIENKLESAFRWLDKAIVAGFTDVQALETERDLRRIRGNPRFTTSLNRAIESQLMLDTITSLYFGEENYVAATNLAQERLRRYPDDEYTLLLVAGALTELREIESGKTWNQKVRNSVRYANFGSYNLGCLSLAEGKIDLAFRYLNLSVDMGFSDVEHLKNDHLLTAVRNDSRFRKLARRMKQAEPVT